MSARTDIAERKSLFTSFGKSVNWQAQSNFIISTVSQSQPKRTTKIDSRVKHSRSYYINKKSV